MVDELQAALPSNRWVGIEQEPGIDSIRTYLYQDQKSYAHIDMDIVPRIEPQGRNSYMISMFASTDCQHSLRPASLHSAREFGLRLFLCSFCNHAAGDPISEIPRIRHIVIAGGVDHDCASIGVKDERLSGA